MRPTAPHEVMGATRKAAAAFDELLADGRPRREIFLTGKSPCELVADAESVLREANNPPTLFVYCGGLARIVSDEDDRRKIVPLNEHALRGMLLRYADWTRERGETILSVWPPMELVRDILSRGAWRLPTVEGIIETPALRPDGSIITKAGYDAATRLYYAPAPDLTIPGIPERPTAAHARQAVAVLDDALGEFPYLDNASHANAIAAAVTPIVRTAITAPVPLGIMDAPTPGTGKTLLGEVLAMVPTGRPAALMTAPREAEEWRKRITSTLIGGATVIVIDNLDEPLASGELSAVITANVWSDRRLGASEMLTIPQRATWFATGNNVQLGGDIPRRCYWTRLDAKTSRPWKGRTFRHPDLIGWVRQNRGQLIAAMLTMARAWYAAGCPDAPSPKIGGFDEWCRVVGGILHFAGVDAFLGNLEQMYEANDDETTAWLVFLSAWHNKLQNSTFNIATLATKLAEDFELRDALPDDLGAVFHSDHGKFKIRLGKALKRRVGRRYGDDGLHLVRGDDVARKVATWSVATGSAGSYGSVPTARTENSDSLRVASSNTPETPDSPDELEAA